MIDRDADIGRSACVNNRWRCSGTRNSLTQIFCTSGDPDTEGRCDECISPKLVVSTPYDYALRLARTGEIEELPLLLEHDCARVRSIVQGRLKRGE